MAHAQRRRLVCAPKGVERISCQVGRVLGPRVVRTQACRMDRERCISEGQRLGRIRLIAVEASSRTAGYRTSRLGASNFR